MKVQATIEKTQAMTAAELIAIANEDIAKANSLLAEGIRVEADAKTTALFMDAFHKLPQLTQIRLKGHVEQIQRDIKAHDTADISRMTNYMAGLLEDGNSPVVSALQPVFNGMLSTRPNKDDGLEAVDVGITGLLIIVIIAIVVWGVIIYLIFKAIESKLNGPIIIHGENDPNGPIGGDGDGPES